MSAEHRRRRTSGLFVVSFALVFVVLAVVAVDAISSRQIESRDINQQADLLEQDAQLIVDQIPDQFRDDRDLTESAGLASDDPASIDAVVAPMAEAMGIALVEADANVVDGLEEQLLSTLRLDEAPGEPTLAAVTRGFAVRGDIHAISNFLEIVGRGTTLLVLSPVHFTFDNGTPTATFSVAALHVVVDTPAERLGRLRIARGATTVNQ